jgi:WD40 repeat protein
MGLGRYNNPDSLVIVDIISGKTRLSIPAHGYDLWSIDWDSKGKRIATGSFDQHVKVFCADTGKQLRDLLHPSGVQSVQFSPNDCYLACATTGHEVFIWDLESAQLLKRLVGHRDRVSSVEWKPDGTELISGGSDRAVRRWMADFADTSGPEVPITEFDADRELVLRRTEGGDFQLYDLGTRRVLNSWQGEQAFWKQDSKTLAIENHSVVSLVGEAIGGDHASFKLSNGHRLIGGWSHDGRLLLSGNESNTEIGVWDVRQGKSIGTVHVEAFGKVHWSPGEPLFAVVRAASQIN